MRLRLAIGLLAASALAAVLGAQARPSPPAGTAAAAPVLVTFLANEGVLLSGGGTRVLIDGLFRDYGKEFAILPDSLRTRVEAARPPFDAVDLILVTHLHGDHFHPGAVAAHLAANPRAILLTSTQVIDSLRRGEPVRPLPAQRLVARTVPFPSRRTEVVGGVRVELLGLPHGGGGRNRRQVEHLAFVVEIGGKRVLHVGDTGGSAEDFAAFRLDTAGIDVALVPAWMVTSPEGRLVIARWIKPRQVIAIHVGTSSLATGPAAIRTVLPGARTFVRPLEQFEVP